MSNRIIAQEIREIRALCKEGGVELGLNDIQPFIAGIAGSGQIPLTVPGGYCALVVALEIFNGDDSIAQTTQQYQSSVAVGEVEVAQWATGADLFYVYPPGTCFIDISATPQGGKTLYARAMGYLLPEKAMRVLSPLALKIFS